MGDMPVVHSSRFTIQRIPFWLIVIVAVIVVTSVVGYVFRFDFFVVLMLLFFLSGLLFYFKIYISQNDPLYHLHLLGKRSSQMSQYLTSFRGKVSHLEKEYSGTIKVLSQLCDQISIAQRTLASHEKELEKMCASSFDNQKVFDNKKVLLNGCAVSLDQNGMRTTPASFKKSKKVVSSPSPLSPSPLSTLSLSSAASPHFSAYGSSLVSPLQNQLLKSNPRFPEQDKKLRITLERRAARLLQDEQGYFTISQLLTTLITVYPQADTLRDKLSMEIKHWIDDDSYITKQTRGVVTQYTIT